MVYRIVIIYKINKKYTTNNIVNIRKNLKSNYVTDINQAKPLVYFKNL